MGTVLLQEIKENKDYKFLRDILKRRGLKFNEEYEEWTVHGPHEGMNYQVWSGGVCRKAEGKCIYPWGTFITEHGEEQKYNPEDRIPTRATFKKYQ